MTLFEPAFLLFPAVGFGIGALYFIGLWWTVHRLKTSRRPTVLTLVSFGLRAGLVLVVFYLTAQGHWERFLSCLAGFILARFGVTRRLGPHALRAEPNPTSPLGKRTDG